MSGNRQSILPLHYTPTGSQAALPVGSQETKTPSATHSSVPSTPSSAAASSADLPITVPPAAAPAPHHCSCPSPAASPSNSPSRTASAASPPSTVFSITSRTAGEASSQASTASNDAGQPATPAGYPKLACKMGDMPETAIFRRFGFLNAQMLLYMQAELVSLEDRLRKVQARDNAAQGSRSLYAKNWFFLGNSTYQADGDESQWELVKEIREKLKEYNEMLIQQLKIVSVNPPNSSDLRNIQRYLFSEDMDNGVLTGKDADLWGSLDNPKGHAPDLLALLGRHNEDFFSSWVTESVVDKLIELQQKRKPLTARRLDELHDKKMLRWTFMVASVLASALPILSIVILYWVRSVKARLGLIAVFNIVLSIALAWFTSAKRAEVFAVSAAFSAVCVVFVQVGTDDSRDASSSVV